MHLPRRILREAIMVAQLVRFYLINRLGGRPVTEPGGPVVSLTTYGKRSRQVYFAIESIARGEVRPSRLILWIDDERLINNLPEAIRRLQDRGLEVKSCRNYGPHTKYYPYVDSQGSFNTPFVTADDDILYPHYWLRRLIDANREYSDAIHCYWAHVLNVDATGIGRYADFQLCISTRSSSNHIALGVMGVIYPPSFLTLLKRSGTAFETCCPKADDLWLHVHALRTGYKVRQILPSLPYYSFQGIPGTQHTALSYENVTYGDGNDQQIAATYTQADIEILRTESDLIGR